MKKLSGLLAAVVVSVSVLGGAASAQTSCSITNGNGTGSNNTCTFNNSTSVTVTCTNGVTSSFVNGQASASGTATANGNTLVGTVSSGNASNLATLANEIAAYCNAQPAAATPPATNTPTGGSGGSGGGGGATTAASAPATVAPKALPATGELNTVEMATYGTVAAATVAGAIQLAVSLYRRRVLN